MLVWFFMSLFRNELFNCDVRADVLRIGVLYVVFVVTRILDRQKWYLAGRYLCLLLSLHNNDKFHRIVIDCRSSCVKGCYFVPVIYRYNDSYLSGLWDRA